jgi:hypothetical protein
VSPDTPTEDPGTLDTEVVASTPSAVPFLRVVRGDPTPEEVAALTVVLQGLAAASLPAEDAPVRSEWAAPARRLRTSYPAGRGGWRSGALPR